VVVESLQIVRIPHDGLVGEVGEVREEGCREDEDDDDDGDGLATAQKLRRRQRPLAAEVSLNDLPVGQGRCRLLC
jgi:hypothetical protein